MTERIHKYQALNMEDVVRGDTHTHCIRHAILQNDSQSLHILRKRANWAANSIRKNMVSQGSFVSRKLVENVKMGTNNFKITYNKSDGGMDKILRPPFP